MQLWLTTKATLLNERASSEALFVALVVHGASPIIRRCQGSRDEPPSLPAVLGLNQVLAAELREAVVSERPHRRAI